jgi:ketosteroid isomerase-like protein
MRSLVAFAAVACAWSILALTGMMQGQMAAGRGVQAGTQTAAQTSSQATFQTASQAEAQAALQAASELLGQQPAPYGLGLGSSPAINPLTQPTLTPGMIQLLELEAKFAESVAAGGGKAFASWFADDAVTLGNGHPPVIGKTAIAAQAQWDPKDYQLTWVAQGAQMGPSNDMGFTWGHYDGSGKDAHGQPITHSGRYMTIWKKMSDGSWKVMLDASADEPAEAGSCCTLPKP